MSRVATNKEYINRSMLPSPLGLPWTAKEFIYEAARGCNREVNRLTRRAGHGREDSSRRLSSRRRPGSPVADEKGGLEKAATISHELNSMDHGDADPDDTAHGFLKIQKAQVPTTPLRTCRKA